MSLVNKSIIGCWRRLAGASTSSTPLFAQRAASTAAKATAPSTPEQPVASTSAAPTSAQWTPASQRTGVLATKVGMTAVYDSVGVRTPVTVLQLEDVAVTAVRTEPYNAVQVGIKNKKEKNTHNALLGQFRKNHVAPKAKLAEFKVTEDALLQPGTELSAAHFVPGQFVDVQGRTIGKGFAGPMKRWGFKGLRASHGVSVSHRSHGSTGQHQDPGRVFPGKKMAGHMGNRLRTQQNLLVMRVDTVDNLVFLKGCVAGHNGNFVKISDAIKNCVSRGRERQRRTALGLSDQPLVGVGNGVASLPFPAATKSMVKEMGLPQSILYNNERK